MTLVRGPASESHSDIFAALSFFFCQRQDELFLIRAATRQTRRRGRTPEKRRKFFSQLRTFLDQACSCPVVPDGRAESAPSAGFDGSRIGSSQPICAARRVTPAIKALCVALRSPLLMRSGAHNQLKAWPSHPILLAFLPHHSLRASLHQCILPCLRSHTHIRPGTTSHTSHWQLDIFISSRPILPADSEPPPRSHRTIIAARNQRSAHAAPRHPQTGVSTVVCWLCRRSSVQTQNG